MCVRGSTSSVHPLKKKLILKIRRLFERTLWNRIRKRGRRRQCLADYAKIEPKCVRLTSQKRICVAKHKRREKCLKTLTPVVIQPGETDRVTQPGKLFMINDDSEVNKMCVCLCLCECVCALFCFRRKSINGSRHRWLCSRGSPLPTVCQCLQYVPICVCAASGTKTSLSYNYVCNWESGRLL